MSDSRARVAGILLVGGFVGVCSGFFGITGGVLLVPMLGLLFGYEQHRAQGTSLVALVPPTGLLALLNYWHAGQVHWKIGLLLMPGVFIGGMLGSKVAQRLSPERMRQVFAAVLFIVGLWQALMSWRM